MSSNFIFNNFDEYDLKARISPGLKVFSSIFITIFGFIIYLGKTNIIYSVESSIFLVLIMFISVNGIKNFVAGKGKEIQNDLWESWGGNPLIKSLEWGESKGYLTNGQRKIIYDFLNEKFNIGLKKTSEKKVLKEASSCIIEYVRKHDPKGIWFNQLIDYGAIRNFLGSKWVFIVLTLLMISFDLVIWKIYNVEIMLYVSVVNMFILIYYSVLIYFHYPKNVKYRSEQYTKNLLGSFLNIIDEKKGGKK